MRHPDTDRTPPGPEGLDDAVRNPYDPSVGSLPTSPVAEEELENVTKTGTTTVGLTTADGVVLATDMRASLGGRFVANKNVQKVEQVHPTAAMTIAGSVGGAQSFLRSIRAEVNLYEARRGEDMSIPALATLSGNFMRGGPFFIVNPILGGVDDDGSHVYSIDPAGGVMDDDYTVTGSGMQLAYGTLEREYEDGLSTAEARTVAARAIDSAMERDTASGDGIFLAEIDAEGVDIQGHKEFAELL